MNSRSLDPSMYVQCLAWKKGKNNTWRAELGSWAGNGHRKTLQLFWSSLCITNLWVNPSMLYEVTTAALKVNTHLQGKSLCPVRSLVIPNSLPHLGPGKPFPGPIEFPIFGIPHQWRHIICDLLCLMYFGHFFRAEQFVVCISVSFCFGGRIVF